ncbi:DUF1963 domain-containing protein [Rhodospira trueperi]|uniref:DUF1963 domain-containing protein n=1 Tax=Rhodospira trueperi TaxID=69960 RepID=A0A1G7BM09_9PROT|nr:DUF1963 domain-containing protein [Rhodospira trueperi]SDE27957.1 protein of unknown function [Rhodospira trueperi]
MKLPFFGRRDRKAQGDRKEASGDSSVETARSRLASILNQNAAPPSYPEDDQPDSAQPDVPFAEEDPEYPEDQVRDPVFQEDDALDEDSPHKDVVEEHPTQDDHQEPREPDGLFAEKSAPANDSLLGGGLSDDGPVTFNLDDASLGAAARLQPMVPIPPDWTPGSWMGGRPRLPDPFTWPMGDTEPFAFLGQIDCADLPAELWGGAGPRTGWLAFFVGSRDDTLAGAIIHAPALGPERTPPARVSADLGGLHDSEDLAAFLNECPKDMRWSTETPRWPVEVRVAHADNLARDDVNPPFQDGFDLRDPACQPFDWTSHRMLLATMSDHVASLLASSADRQAALQARRQKTPEDGLLAVDKELQAIEASITALEDVASALSRWIDKTDATRAETPFSSETWRLVYETLADLAQDPKRPLVLYPAYAYDIAKQVYARDPDALPDPVRARFERRWAEDARREGARMGGEPEGCTSILGFDTDVLVLETPFSYLLGWSWHDFYPLVFSALGPDLKRGEFGYVKVEITN